MKSVEMSRFNNTLPQIVQIHSMLGCYYYCVTNMRTDSKDTLAESGQDGWQGGVAGWQWIEDYAVLCARVAPRGV